MCVCVCECLELTIRFQGLLTLECPYTEFFWSVFSRIRTEYGEILHILFYSGPEKLLIRTLFTQWKLALCMQRSFINTLGTEPCKYFHIRRSEYNIFSSPDILSGKNDVTSDKVTFKHQTKLFKKISGHPEFMWLLKQFGATVL